MARQTPNKGIRNPKLRQAGYIVLGAALAVLTVFDVITEDVAQQVESIVLQVLAVLGFSLAGVNTPKKDAPDLHDPIEHGPR